MTTLVTRELFVKKVCTLFLDSIISFYKNIFSDDSWKLLLVNSKFDFCQPVKFYHKLIIDRLAFLHNYAALFSDP